jgi:glycerophosphoryl diester phosphodiesterase
VKYGFAHRGGAHGLDNTLAAFAGALAQGARCLETDAWLSQDGAVVLDHDGVAGPGRREPIAEVRRDQLPAHIPTLDELYDDCGTDFELAIDVHTAVIAEAVVAVAQRYGAANRIWLVAPQASHLEAFDGAHRAVTVRGNVIRSRRRGGALASAHASGVEAINTRWMWWTRGMVEEVHAMGMLAFGYDAQRRSSLDRCMAIGLDGVFSDHVDRMLAAIAAAERWADSSPVMPQRRVRRRRPKPPV